MFGLRLMRSKPARAQFCLSNFVPSATQFHEALRLVIPLHLSAARQQPVALGPSAAPTYWPAAQLGGTQAATIAPVVYDQCLSATAGHQYKHNAMCRVSRILHLNSLLTLRQ